MLNFIQIFYLLLHLHGYRCSLGNDCRSRWWLRLCYGLLWLILFSYLHLPLVASLLCIAMRREPYFLNGSTTSVIAICSVILSSFIWFAMYSLIFCVFFPAVFWCKNYIVFTIPLWMCYTIFVHEQKYSPLFILVSQLPL